MLRISIFTDCRDSNAVARQQLRYGALFPNAEIHCFGATSAIEVSGCVVDALDAVRGTAQGENIIVGNIAPRSDKRHKNGAPFCFSRLRDGLIVIGTPTTFTLARKLGLIEDVYKTDVKTVCESFLFPDTVVGHEPPDRITNSQFRSYDYVPRLADWLWRKEDVPCIKTKIKTDDFDGRVWFIDCFGNSKIVSSRTDIDEAVRKGFISFAQKFDLPFYEKLKDVPKGKMAVIVGSSGYYNGDDHRFLEIVKQGGNAAKELGLNVGDLVL